MPRTGPQSLGSLPMPSLFLWPPSPLFTVLPAADGAAQDTIYPLIILAIGTATVLGLILVLRVNAFIALLCAALTVSLLAPGETGTKVARVAVAFGQTAGAIGIVIAFAAVIGATMMKSGAADRIVRTFVLALGERHGPTVLLCSGYTLSIPVFFDTVFYLLVPLARSFYRRRRKNYLLCLLAIGTGGALTHTLVPPTPGPLMVAATLGIDVGVMMVAGAVMAIPSAIVGLAFARYLDRTMPVEMVEQPGEDEGPALDEALPGLGLALAPVVLPIILIGSQTVLKQAATSSPHAASWLSYAQIWGNPNLALLIAMAISIAVYVRQRQPSRSELSQTVEDALMSGGLIILITAAGGAFGAMLRAAGIDQAIGALIGDVSAAGLGLLALGFILCAVIKTAQGSTTTALIVTSSIVASIVPDMSAKALGFHPVYLATAIGGGGLVATWMNDSGFWIFARMSGLSEVQALRTLTPTTAVIGTVTFVCSAVGAWLLPMA